MPAIAAHYQYSRLVAQKFPKKLSELINQNEPFFTIGAQGPDLLFYHKPLKKNAISSMGIELHTFTGKDFFSEYLDRKYLDNDKRIAYLLGVCCHYGLDRTCHPYINKVSSSVPNAHGVLESDFDSFIIKNYDLSKKRHIYIPKITDYSAIADVYSIDGKSVKICCNSFKLFAGVLNHRNLIFILELFLNNGGKFHALTMKDKLDYQEECEDLFDMFKSSVDRTAKFAENFFEAIVSKNKELQDCDEDFDGTIVT